MIHLFINYEFSVPSVKKGMSKQSEKLLNGFFICFIFSPR